MKTILFPAVAFGCATLLGLSAHTIAASAFDAEDSIQMAGSSDGAGLPGFPGGRGGKSGRELAREENRRPSRYSGADDDTDPRLVDYCVGVLKSDGRSRGRSEFRPSDCAEYFMALDSAQGGRRTGDAGRRGGDGEDGASIAGGQGGQGGRSGGGPGGGRGGGGGAGVSGGTGGKGGAGGGGY